MAELRITLRFEDAAGGDERRSMLDALGQALAGVVGGEQQPRAIPEPGDDGQLHPMFLLRADDTATVNAVMRAVGGWAMQHPEVPLVLKATGRGGRVAFEVKRFSTVAFAQAGARLADVVGGTTTAET